MSFVPAPLHRVHVKSKLVTVIFSLAVRNSFPIDWVDFIMGNDLAGGKVYPVPEVLEVAISGVEPDVLAQEHPDLFSVSVLTRTQAHNLAQEVELSDSVLAANWPRTPLLPGSLGSVPTKRPLLFQM